MKFQLPTLTLAIIKQVCLPSPRPLANTSSANSVALMHKTFWLIAFSKGRQRKTSGQHVEPPGETRISKCNHTLKTGWYFKFIDCCIPPLSSRAPGFKAEYTSDAFVVESISRSSVVSARALTCSLWGWSSGHTCITPETIWCYKNGVKPLKL